MAMLVQKTIRTCTCSWSLLFPKERRLARYKVEWFALAGEKVALHANRVGEAAVQVFRGLGFTLCPASVRMGGRWGCTAGPTNIQVPTSSPDPPLDVAAMVAIAVPARREPPRGDGGHRRASPPGAAARRWWPSSGQPAG